MTVKVKVFKTSPVELPKESTPMSAAKDIRANVQAINPLLVFNGEISTAGTGVATGFVENAPAGTDVPVLILRPNGRALVPSGLIVEIPDEHSMDVRPRSGLSLKYGLEVVNSPGLIDPDYRGDVGIIIKNGGDKPIVIVDGERIAQIKLTKDVSFEWEEVAEKADLSDTKRGAGGFSSTGTK